MIEDDSQIKIKRTKSGQVYPQTYSISKKQAQSEYHMKSSLNGHKHKIPEIIHSQMKKLARLNKQKPPLKQSKFLKNASKITRSKNLQEKYNTQKCQICELQVSIRSLQCIGKCSHQFCSQCLHQYIIYKINAFQYVQCPNDQCRQPLLTNSLIYSKLPLNIRKKFRKIIQYKQLQQNPNKKLCPQQNCDGYMIIPEENLTLICNVCNKKFCPKCHFQQHEGQCDNNQLEFFHGTLHYRQCQKCKKIIQKTSGCNHITCTCGYQFCYICGGKWRHSHLCRNPDDEPIYNPIDCQCLCFQCQCPNCCCCQCLQDCCYDCCEYFQQCCCDGCINNCLQSIGQHLCCCCNDDECCECYQENIICRIIIRFFFTILWIIFLPVYLVIIIFSYFARIIGGAFMGLCVISCQVFSGENQYVGELECWQIALMIIFFPITCLFFMGLGIKAILQDDDCNIHENILCCYCQLYRQCLNLDD